MKVGIDIMGGDYAPEKTVHGAVLALKQLKKNVQLFLFGKKNKITAELKKHSCNPNEFEIIDCSEVIEMDEPPTRAFRSKLLTKKLEVLGLPKKQKKKIQESDKVENIPLNEERKKILDLYRVGEEYALDKLDEFIDQKILVYKQKRDFFHTFRMLVFAVLLILDSIICFDFVEKSINFF